MQREYRLHGKSEVAGIMLSCLPEVLIWLRSMIRIQGYYPIKLVGCIVIGIVGTIMCAIVFLRIVTGYEDKQNARYMDESKRRLQDRNYVDKLISFGYTVPDEFTK